MKNLVSSSVTGSELEGVKTPEHLICPESDQLFGGYQYQTEMLTRTYHKVKSDFGFDVIERQRDGLISRVHKLELENQKLKCQLDQMSKLMSSQSARERRRSFLVWVLSLFALITSGLVTALF